MNAVRSALMRTRVDRVAGLIGLAALTGAIYAEQAAAPLLPKDAEPFSCPVTLVNEGRGGPYSNEFIEVVLPPRATIVAPPRENAILTADGALAWKFGWDRRTKGRLSISGRRLDSAGPPLSADIPDGYGDIGFQPMYLIFPTPGCWEVTGKLGTQTLTFVILALQTEDRQPQRDDKWYD